MGHLVRRSVFADKLKEYPAVAFGDEEAFGVRGKWREYFKGKMGRTPERLVLEVGCFDGAFLTGVAQEHPWTAFVGLDWKAKAVYEAATRIAAAELKNTAVIRGRAQELLKMFGEEEVDEIWVFHPEPCEREEEAANRLMTREFLIQARRLMRGESSAVVLKTDHEGYFRWVLSMFEEGVEGLVVSSSSADFWGDKLMQEKMVGRCFSGRRTGFEERFVKKRKPIYFVEMRRRL